MPEKRSPKVKLANKALVITRVFDAPCELVWEAWTDPKQVAKWWGPHMFTNPVCELDVRPGGAILIHMKGPDGPAQPMKGVFREVVRPQRLVFTTSAFHDDDGNPGIETLNTVTFTERNGKTTMRLEARFTKAKPEFAFPISGHKAGWNQSLDRLFALLSGSPEFVITRLVDAPRDLVWKAHTELGRLKQWWGPKGMTWLSAHLQLRPGGFLYYGMRTPDGYETWLKYVYREIDAPERLSFVFSLSDEKGGIARHPMSATWPPEILSTLTFFEVEGKTAVTMSYLPINATEEERKTFKDGYANVKQGFKGTYDQLEEYLATTKEETSHAHE